MQPTWRLLPALAPRRTPSLVPSSWRWLPIEECSLGPAALLTNKLRTERPLDHRPSSRARSGDQHFCHTWRRRWDPPLLRRVHREGTGPVQVTHNREEAEEHLDQGLLTSTPGVFPCPHAVRGPVVHSHRPHFADPDPENAASQQALLSGWALLTSAHIWPLLTTAP